MKKLMTSHLALSVVIAIAIIASAFVFKGNPAGGWIETALVGAALAFVVLKPQRPLCSR